MKSDILILCPLHGNGGIVSWTHKFLDSFPSNDYQLFPVDISPEKDFTDFRGLDNWWYGFKSFIRSYKKIRKVISLNPQIKLMHTTTSGGNGVLRDYYLGNYCRRKGLKTILHCRFGSIYEHYEAQNLKGYYFRKALINYDQIWVLDQKSASFLRSKSKIKDKVFLTPNSIEVQDSCEIPSKSYHRIGFIGNLLPSKGIFELIDAVLSLGDDTELVIAGKGSKEITNKITIVADNNKNKINFLGHLPNNDAVKLIDTLDILALPTYYDQEAFPISILEAMSKGKIVISCARAAIPDMLKCTDGSLCGILVNEKSPQAIANAIRWCQNHPTEADAMCNKAYEKVKSCYREEVVYQIYRNNYNIAIMK